MKKFLAILFCLAAVSAYAAISDDTTLNISPACVLPGQFYNFAMTIQFRSPDGETLKGSQFWIGDSWEFGDFFLPPEGSIGGFWSAHMNPTGNVVEWEFTRDFGEPGGGVADGESVVFEFEATVGTEEDLGVQMHLFGDVGGPGEPHDKAWPFDYPPCSDDDATDDATDDTDDWHDDAGDDSADDGTDDSADDTEPNFDFDDDTSAVGDDDDGGSSGCGC